MLNAAIASATPTPAYGLPGAGTAQSAVPGALLFHRRIKAMSDCIIWQGVPDHGGYGRTYVDGVKRQAHRVAYCAHHGLSIYEISGKVVRHTCDNPICINPDHLLIGTHADNVRDKVSRGRQARQLGEDHGGSKLKSEQVIEIRKKHASGSISERSLAKEYGVSQKTIWGIVNRKRWSHI